MEIVSFGAGLGIDVGVGGGCAVVVFRGAQGGTLREETDGYTLEVLDAANVIHKILAYGFARSVWRALVDFLVIKLPGVTSSTKGRLSSVHTVVVVSTVSGIWYESTDVMGVAVGVAAAAAIMLLLTPEAVKVRPGGGAGLLTPRVVAIALIVHAAVRGVRHHARDGVVALKETPVAVLADVAAHALMLGRVEVHSTGAFQRLRCYDATIAVTYIKAMAVLRVCNHLAICAVLAVRHAGICATDWGEF